MNRTNKSQLAMLSVFFYLIVHPIGAEELYSGQNDCLLNALKDAKAEQSASEIKARCDAANRRPPQSSDADQPNGTNQIADSAASEPISRIDRRIRNEKMTLGNPAVITSHQRNYMFPITYVKEQNSVPFVQPLSNEKLDNVEAKFQLSFKAPLLSQIFDDQDLLFFGFTLQSYWQLYNSELSSPFRETNYQPEIFYAIENQVELGEWTNKGMMFGIEHQSNGRTQRFSRSWNRIYANFFFEKDNWVVSFKPWLRLSEKRKENPDQPTGDDNPDIEKYMGHFELSTIYSWDDQNFSLLVRNNLRSENRGAVQLDWTFPLDSRFKGYLQYFNGYGESLIDYNHHVERIGFGVALTDFL